MSRSDLVAAKGDGLWRHRCPGATCVALCRIDTLHHVVSGKY